MSASGPPAKVFLNSSCGKVKRYRFTWGLEFTRSEQEKVESTAS